MAHLRPCSSLLFSNWCSAEALGIRCPSESQFLRNTVYSLDCVIEQSELTLKGGVTIFGQRADQVFNHCTQPPYNLNAICTVPPKFGAG